MDDQEIALRARFCRESYPAYCYYVHGGRWIDSRFHTFLARTVQEFIEEDTGHPYDVLVLSTPPQHGKSMTVTETLPSWYTGKYPDRRCIVACYSDDFAGRFGRRNRQKLRDYGQSLFGIRLAKSTDRDIEIADHGGSIIFRGIQSGITGSSAELIVVDDPVKNRAEADSPTYRDRVWEEWENSILTRHQAGTKIIVIQTRWHEDDLAGRIIEREPHVKVVNIPVEAEDNDPLGRLPGQALCPEIGKGDDWLRQIKERYIAAEGSRAWYALYQGKPVTEGGNIIHREWWQYYDELPKQLPIMAISVDAAFKDTGDFVAIEVWGKADNNYYLIDLLNRRMDFPETVRAIRAINDRYPQRTAILIEDKANGSAIISTLRHELPGIIEISPTDGKITRVNAIAGLVEAGNVYLPRYAEFTPEFIEQFSAFPNGTHDDMVDAATQFISKYQYSLAPVKDDSMSEFDKQLDRWRKKQLNAGKKRRGAW